MSKHEPSDAARLAAVLAREPAGACRSAYHCAKAAEILVRLGRRAQRIAERRCNGVERYDSKAGRVLASWTEADEKAADRACEKIKVEAIAALVDFEVFGVEVGGDPRGYCLKFRLPSGASNSAERGMWGV